MFIYFVAFSEYMNFTEKSKKFEFSEQGRGFAPFVGNGTKVKIPSEIKPPLLPFEI